MIRLFNEDCLPAMRAMKDKQFQLALVDPPYGIGAENGTGDYSKAVSPRGKKWDISPGNDYFHELLRVSISQIIWGGNYFPVLPISRGWLCWYKTDEVRGRDFSEFELAWTSLDMPARHLSFKPFIRNSERIHPTQKPVSLYRELLERYAKPGDHILDTHCGSGSILIACDIMGYDIDAYEIDLDYYTAAKARLERHQRQAVMTFDGPAIPFQVEAFPNSE